MNDEIDIEDLAPWLVVFITMAGGVLRVMLLGTKGMSLDETFSVWMANQSVGGMLQWIVKIDQQPPLYYFLLHFWIAVTGNSAYYVRLLSVLFGTGTIPMIYLIGKRISGAVLGVAAAAILAFSPFNIFYSQDTGMYTLLTFNAAVAIYALVRLLTDPSSVRPIGSQFRDYLHAWRTFKPVDPGSEADFSKKDETRDRSNQGAWFFRHRWLPIQTVETDLAWVAWIVFTALTLYSHNTAVFFPLAANIFVLGLMLYQRKQKTGPQPAFQAPSFWNWAMVQAGIFILWIPWVSPFIQQTSAVFQRFWIPAPTWGAVLQALKSFLNASTSFPANIATVIWIVYALVLCLGLVYYRKKIKQFLFLVTMFAIPFLGELVVSIWRPIFLDRTLIWITIPLYVMLAAGVAQLKFRPVVFVMMGILIVINLFATADYYRFFQNEDWNTAARDVAGYTEKGDLVLFNSNLAEIPFDYYFIPYETYYGLQVEKLGVPQDLVASGISQPAMTNQDIPGLISLLKGHSRVWLIYSHNAYTDPMGLIPQTLASQMKLTQTDNFNGGQVQLYVSP